MGLFNRNKNNPTSQSGAGYGGSFATQTVLQPLANPQVMRSATLRIRNQARSNPVDLQKTGHVNLSKATISLQKKIVEIVDAWFDAQVEVHLDHSGSMEWGASRYYSDGYMQNIAERSLAAGLELDADGTVPVTAFDNALQRSVDVNLGNYQGVVNRDIWQRDNMGGTQYAPIFRSVLERAKATNHPMIIMVVTDGEPGDAYETRLALAELSQYPVFVKFLSLESNSFLDELDDALGVPQLIDNISCEAFDGHAFPKLANLTDDQFAQAFFKEMDEWMNRALAAGILVEA